MDISKLASLQPAATVAKPIVGQGTGSAATNTGTLPVVAAPVNTTFAERAKAFFVKGLNVDGIDNARLLEELKSDNVLDASDYNLFNGELLASLNLQAVSVDQVDCFIEPGRFFERIVQTHAPSRVSLQPTVAIFDDTGALSGPSIGANNGVFNLETKDVQVTGFNEYKQIGWFFKISQFNTERGKSAIQIRTNALNAAFDMSDRTKEARLVILNTQEDVTLSIGASQVSSPSGEEPVAASPVITGAVRDLTAYLDVAMKSESTLPSTAVAITAQNVNIYAYPIVVTREVITRVTDLFARDEYDTLASHLLDYM